MGSTPPGAGGGKPLLRHLREETGADIASILAIRDEHRQSAANYGLLLGAVRGSGPCGVYARLGDDGCNLLRLPAVRYHSPQGLEAGERADLISDAELRHRIRAANAERAFNDRQLDCFRDAFDRYSNVIEPFLEWRPANPAPSIAGSISRASPPIPARWRCCRRPDGTSSASPDIGTTSWFPRSAWRTTPPACKTNPAADCGQREGRILANPPFVAYWPRSPLDGGGGGASTGTGAGSAGGIGGASTGAGAAAANFRPPSGRTNLKLPAWLVMSLLNSPS